VIVFIGVFSKVFGGSYPEILEKTIVFALKSNVLAVFSASLNYLLLRYFS
jgi:hypothetical protein